MKDNENSHILSDGCLGNSEGGMPPPPPDVLSRDSLVLGFRYFTLVVREVAQCLQGNLSRGPEQ